MLPPTEFLRKRLLLKMIEWHARTLKGGHCDTWHDGRFMERLAYRYPTLTDEYAVELVSTLLSAEIQTDTSDGA